MFAFSSLALALALALLAYTLASAPTPAHNLNIPFTASLSTPLLHDLKPHDNLQYYADCLWKYHEPIVLKDALHPCGSTHSPAYFSGIPTTIQYHVHHKDPYGQHFSTHSAPGCLFTFTCVPDSIAL
tara:strand:+ start:80 stop:460 length:381 start_codon:yes stop_codon:yes gene_type:complete